MDIYVHPGINKIKEVYRENTFPLCGSVGKDITTKSSIFPWSGVSSGLATSLIVANNQRKRHQNDFPRKISNRLLKDSLSKKFILPNKSMPSIYYFADINECETEKHHCDSNAFCNNTKGSYNCTCIPGYTGNGVNCTGEISNRKPSADGTK